MNRILAIQVKQIGDVVLTLPALRLLRRRFPDAYITFAVSAPAAGLAPLFACVDQVIGVGKGWFEPALWRQIALPRCHTALDFSGTDRSRFLSLLSGAALRAGYSKHGEGFFRRHSYTRSVEIPLREHHTIDYFIQLLASLGIDPTEEPLTATLPGPADDPLPAIAGTGATELSALNEDFAVFHPGTARPEKYWLPERWARVIEHVAANGLTPVITGAAGEAEMTHIEQIRAALGSSVQIVDLAGKLDLLGSARVISRSRIFLGVDTAAMHLASAFQRPLVALFGPTSAFRWRPGNPEARVILSGQETPVTRYRMEDEEGDMSDISTAAVLGAVDQLLAEEPATSTGRFEQLPESSPDG